MDKNLFGFLLWTDSREEQNRDLDDFLQHFFVHSLPILLQKPAYRTQHIILRLNHQPPINNFQEPPPLSPISFIQKKFLESPDPFSSALYRG